MLTKRQYRRFIRKRIAETALGLSPVEDDIERQHAARTQRKYLNQRDSLPWLARRLEGREITLYE